MTTKDGRRRLPSVERVIRAIEDLKTAERRPAASRAEIARAARSALEALRGSMTPAAGAAPPVVGDAAELLELSVAATLGILEVSARPSLRRVINATGVALHTNLGRAPLSPEAVAAMVSASGYTNLELSLTDGARQSRQSHTRDLLRDLTGAEDALVVNNNAAAVWLVLRAVARDRAVVVSRGELVEIGESFRLPDIMAEAGVRLVEVGTTNRTTVDDYRRALESPRPAGAGAPAGGSCTPAVGAPGPVGVERPAAVVLVHPSNYRIVGFASRPDRREVAAAAHAAGAVVVEDLGSGALVDLSPWGLGGEPTPRQALAAGVDAVTFSGDKLLGGPQCGVVAGKASIVAALRRDPVLRCLRPDKTTLAGVEATLALYRDLRLAVERVPVLRILTEPAVTVRRRAVRARRLISGALAGSDPGAALDLVPSVAEAGGGSLPGTEVETWALRLSAPGLSPDELWRRLARLDPPVIARRHRDALLLDFRTVTDAEVPALARGVAAALRELAGG